MGRKPKNYSGAPVGPQQTPKIEGPAAQGPSEVVSHVPPSPPNPPPPASASQDNTPPWKKAIEIVAVAIAVFLLIVNIYQMRATQNAADAAKSAAETSKQTLIVSNRPWIGPVFKESPITLGKPGDPVKWRVYFKNSGNSPALKVQWHTRLFQLKGVGTDDTFRMIEVEIEKLTLGDTTTFTVFSGEEAPNTSYSSSGPVDSRFAAGPIPFIPDGALRLDVANQTQTLALGGRVIYYDEFGGHHETTFCILYIPATGEQHETWQSCPVKQITN